MHRVLGVVVLCFEYWTSFSLQRQRLTSSQSLDRGSAQLRGGSGCDQRAGVIDETDGLETTASGSARNLMKIMRDDASVHNFPESVDGFSDHNYLCCFGHAHCKTGAEAVAYFELVALTSLVSFLFADYMVYGYTSTITYGLIITIIQAYFVFSLIYGISCESGKFLISNLVALSFISIGLFLHVMVVLYACLDEYPNLNSLRRTAIPRIIMSIIGALLIGASIRILYRCYYYFMDLETARCQSSVDLIPMYSDRSIQSLQSLSVEDLNRAASREENKFRYHQSKYYEATKDLDDEWDAGMQC